MSQPKWKYVGTVGDINPVANCGALVLVDTTGVYDAEVEAYLPNWAEKFRDEDNKVVRDNNGDPEFEVYVYRFDVPRHVVHEGVVVEVREYERLAFRQSQGETLYSPWRLDKLDSIGETTDRTREEMIADLCSDDPIRRADVFFNDICGYYGFEEFDSYPLLMTNTEAEARCDYLMTLDGEKRYNMERFSLPKRCTYRAFLDDNEQGLHHVDVTCWSTASSEDIRNLIVMKLEKKGLNEEIIGPVYVMDGEDVCYHLRQFYGSKEELCAHE